MALRASYYGLKKRILDKVLGDYDTTGVMTNKELTEKLTPQTGTITNQGSDEVHANTRLVKSGNVVTLGLYLSAVTANANEWIHVANIPEGFRPRATDAHMIGFCWAGGTKLAQIQAVANGRIQIYSSEALSNTVILANLTWITD